MELPKITDVEIQELKTYEDQAISVTDEAKMVARTIHDAATHEAAAQWVAAKKAWCDKIEKGWLGQQRDKVFKMHRDWCSKINELIHPVQGKDGRSGAIGIVIEAQLVWKRAEDKRIADINAKLLAEAKEKDTNERLAAAEKLEAQGNKTMADAVLSQAGNFVAPVVQQEKSKTVAYRKVWRIEIDPSKKGELLQMIAARPHLYSFVKIDDAAVLAQAKIMDGNLILEDGKTPWPGVRVFQDDVPAYNKRGF
jgi:hypothetical protein